jgi:hypothetical protein
LRPDTPLARLLTQEFHFHQNAAALGIQTSTLDSKIKTLSTRKRRFQTA